MDLMKIDPQMIDHTLLKADATESMIALLCDEAILYGFKSVCINPCWIRFAADRLNISSVLVATVVGFPLGAGTTATKVAETLQCVDLGADELDMVINIGALKSGHLNLVGNEIEQVVASASGKTIKVIIETCYLSEAEKVSACQLAKRAGAHFVKTSTGFGSHGATLEDVALMRREVGEEMGVKASGGIRDLKTALAMVAHGATRLGTSSGVQIVNATRH